MRTGVAKTILLWELGMGAMLPAAVRSAEEPVVALFEIEDKGSGLTAAALSNYHDYLAVLLAQEGYQIIPRDQIRMRLEQTKQETYQPVYDQNSQIELGRSMAANKTLATQILKIGQECRLNATLYDLKQSVTEKAASVKALCTEDELGKAVEEIALKLSGAAPAEPAAAQHPLPADGAKPTVQTSAAPVPPPPSPALQLRRNKARLLMKLPPEMRELLILKQVKRLTIPQIAQKMGIPHRQVLRRLAAARMEMKRLARSDPSLSSLGDWEE